MEIFEIHEELRQKMKALGSWQKQKSRTTQPPISPINLGKYMHTQIGQAQSIIKVENFFDEESKKEQ